MSELQELDICTKIKFIGINKLYTDDKGIQRKTSIPITRPPLDVLKNDKNRYYTYKDYYNRFVGRNNNKRVFIVYGILQEIYYDGEKRQYRPVEWSFLNIKGVRIYRRLQELYGDSIKDGSIIVKDVIDITDKYDPDDIKRYIDKSYDAAIDGQLDQYLSTINNKKLQHKYAKSSRQSRNNGGTVRRYFANQTCLSNSKYIK